MPGTIILNPDADASRLTEVIMEASATDQSILLQPGTYFTRPGRGRSQRIKIGANGLTIKGSGENPASVIIKRPDASIDLAAPDDNYGLYFIPDDATTADFAAVTNWKPAVDGEGNPFVYAVITRGVIRISGLTFNCNMDRQGLEDLAADQNTEHSCMVGFSGASTKGTGPYAGKRIFIAFEKVELTDLVTMKGGYADDIWIARGYFNPNIKEVIISGIQSTGRVQPKRGSICFSGLAEKIVITDAQLYRLECEETSSRWEELPRAETGYFPSQWVLRNITTDYLDLAAKGKSIYLNAVNIRVNKHAFFYQTGGLVQKSTFYRENREPALNRLNDMIFLDVKWTLKNTGNQEIKFIYPKAQYNEECSVTFIRNRFKVQGAFSRGRIVHSEYSRDDPGNKVSVAFFGCSFDDRFGSADYPDTCVANVQERGVWIFEQADFGNRDLSSVFRTNPARKDVVLVLH